MGDKSTLIWDSKNFFPIQEIVDEESVSLIIRDGNFVWAASDKKINIWEYIPIVSRQTSSATIAGIPGPTRATYTAPIRESFCGSSRSAARESFFGSTKGSRNDPRRASARFTIG